MANISLIVATDMKGGIGTSDNSLPWKIKKEL